MLRPLRRYHGLAVRAQEALAAVGLGVRAGREVRHLPHGEQRQLEIALALAGRPRVLLLDEPCAGLSPAESHMMADLLRRLDPAITVLIIEHDMDIALEIAQHVTVLHYGRVIADGLRDQVKADPMVREIYLGAWATARAPSSRSGTSTPTTVRVTSSTACRSPWRPARW